MRTKVSYMSNSGGTIDLSAGDIAKYNALSGKGSITTSDTEIQGYMQDGNTLMYSQLDPREMTLNVFVKGNTHEEYLMKKEALYKAFRLKEEGLLYYNDGLHDVQITCHPTTPPQCDREDNSRRRWAYFDIPLMANDPLFYDKNPTLLDLMTFTGGFSLKREVGNSGSGTLPLRTPGTTLRSAINDGHVEVPIEVHFSGPATKPFIRNSKTGEFIKITQTLSSTQKLIINTDYSKKSVQIYDSSTGRMTNAYSYIDPLSDMFYLSIGDNVIVYGSDDVTLPNDVKIIFRKAYGGV